MGLSRRRGEHVLASVLVGYLSVIAFGVFGPAPGQEIRDAGAGVRRAAAAIGAAVPGSTGFAESVSGLTPFRDGSNDEPIANAIMFLVLGLLFPLVARRWRWWTVPAGVALSSAIELIQLFFLSWRSPSLQDIAWNGVGTVIGFSLWLCLWLWLEVGLRRRPGESPT